MRHRIEHDSLGTVRVPAAAYWGAQTQRALEIFTISGQRFPRRFLGSLGQVKRACALANEDLGLLDTARAEWISAAAQEVADGRWDDQFPLDVFQTGSGTSIHMNANEVIANRAIELMGGTIGSRTPVHPNDHVNRSQSSNDVIPTVLHVAAATALHEDLLPALSTLAQMLEDKARMWDSIVKTGRTHLMDATPIRLGQVAGGWAAQVRAATQRAEHARDALLPVALGGTAVGTGINCPPGFAAGAIARIADQTGLPFRETANHVAAQSAQDAAVSASGEIRAIAVSLIKVANDIRWLGSGPRAGLGELRLPETQPGSSIMPGKVNPVLPEMLVQVGYQVLGNDVVVGLAGQGGSFELNANLPAIAVNLLGSINLLASGVQAFTTHCVRGLQPDEDGCRRGVERNLMLATALAPRLGYDAAAAIAKEAAATNRTIREVAAERSGLDSATLDQLLDPRAMTGD